MYGVLLLVLWLMCEFGIDVVLDVFEYYFIGCECMYDFDGVLLLYGLEVCLVQFGVDVQVYEYMIGLVLEVELV